MVVGEIEREREIKREREREGGGRDGKKGVRKRRVSKKKQSIEPLKEFEKK